MFVAGTAFSDYFYNPKPSDIGLEIKKQWVTPILIILIAGAMVNPIYSLILHGFSLQALLDMREVLEMNKEISVERYSGSEARNIVSQFFLIFSYTAPVIGGFCYRLVGKWNKALCIITLIPGTFIALTQSLKMGMITSFMTWFASYIVCSYTYELSIRIKMKSIIRFVGAVSGLFLILFVSMVFRYGEINGKTIIETSQKFVTYALGHMHNVDIWYTTYMPTDLTWGSKTFMGISNTFTIFRPLTEDFGEVGAMIFMFLMGLVANMSLKALITHRSVYLNQMLLVAIYAYLMWGFSASFYAYTSFLAMFFVIYFIFRFLQIETKTC